MHNWYEVSWHLGDLITGEPSVVYLRTEPEVLDFTSNMSGKIIIENYRKRIEIEVDANNIAQVYGTLDLFIFKKDYVRLLLCWNFKSLVSYIRFHIPKFVPPTSPVIDLSVLENFLGIKKRRPEKLAEAVNRSKVVSRYKDSWKPIYQAIHQPLMVAVLPSIETTPLIDNDVRKSVYPYYEIEGTANGRMSCLKKFEKGYTSHNMGPDLRKRLKPQGEGFRFLLADFSSNEVSVLQWLSKDEKLKEIQDSGEDSHRAIYRVVTGDQCDTDTKRKMSKRMFLPVMYGMGAKTLSKNIGVDESVSAEMIRRIRSIFSTAEKWMSNQSEKAKQNGEHEDYFHRRRKFKENESYLARNFSVQGVAATFCQEKLINLHNQLDRKTAHIAYSVHDGYGIVFQAKKARKVYDKVKEILELDSKLCPGLNIKVEIKFGIRLDDMRVIWKD